VIWSGPHEAGGAVKFFSVVFRFPGEIVDLVFENNGSVDDLRCRCKALVQCGGVDDRFKSGARLATGLNGPVELALHEVAPADHYLHQAGFRFNAQQGALGIGNLIQGKVPQISLFCFLTTRTRMTSPVFEHLADLFFSFAW
jgi:hypothetical protein